MGLAWITPPASCVSDYHRSMGASSDRAGYVRYQQLRAREALARGQPRAARAALRVLRVTDFIESAAADATALLAELRHSEATEEQLRSVVVALLALELAPQPPE